ncbi:MAG: hypothetical protein M1836_003378 [Candelina mexicana]|nr:MAG: hypothetical protein M1836_003378 [Candelina mexicana]
MLSQKTSGTQHISSRPGGSRTVSMESQQKGTSMPSTNDAPVAPEELSNGAHGAHALEHGFVNGSHEDKVQTQSGLANYDHNAVRKVFLTFSSLLHASLRPLPNQTGDGTYIENTVPSGFWKDLKALGIKDAETLIMMLKSKHSGSPVDDKTYLMERVIQLASGLPSISKHRGDLTNSFISDLWNSLPHPPQSFLGSDYVYRQADGSGNNVLFPQVGAANTPYARSVRPSTMQQGALPDPSTIFDCVMARKDYTPHPNKISSMLFYVASIIIHDLFRTDHVNFNKSQTSSYLDLAPLYGSVQHEQDAIRTFKDGKIKPDCFSEKRLIGFPNGVGCILIMFNRYHNYIVEQLAAINEGGRFVKPRNDLPEVKAKEAWVKYDNDLFQTGRLIVCGLYINVILVDYVRVILNLNRSNSDWNLDPRTEMFGENSCPRATGNQVAAEFNLIYRWHSAISDRDDKWTQDLYREMFKGKEPEDVTLPELLGRLGQWEESMSSNPAERPFAKLKRGSDGRFADDDLVRILTESIEDCAGSFGANRVPKVLKAIEILGIEQARSWNLASLNEFRKFFNLKPHETFEDINSDPHVAGQLRHLYDHPDLVELYPGLVAEEAKVPLVPGSGLCPSFTVSRAVLSDAVALVRGDRFYTTDYHPKNLTNWGYTEAQSEKSVNQGCVFYKLLLRVFPNHFKQNSVYAHYPLTVPSEMKKILTELGRADNFSYDRPAFVAPDINILSYAGTKSVLENPDVFKITWGPALEFLMGRGGRDAMLSGDSKFYARQRQTMWKALYRDKWIQQVKEFYETTTLRLLQERSYKLAGIDQVDLVRDVGNLVHVHFAADVFSLPLKTANNPRGVYSEHELYMVMSLVFICIFFDLDPAKSFPMRQAAKIVTQQLGKLVQLNVEAVHATGFVAGVVEKLFQKETALSDYGVHMVRRLLDTGMSVPEVAWSQIMPTAGGMVAVQGQLPPSTMEAARLASTVGVSRDVASPANVTDNGRSIPLKPGDRVFVDFITAGSDPSVFPDPKTVRLDRPLDSYIHFGYGSHKCLGSDLSPVALTAMLKTVGRLDGLRRAKGVQGEIKKVPVPGGFYAYMTEDCSRFFPFPTSLKVQWDGGLKDDK